MIQQAKIKEVKEVSSNSKKPVNNKNKYDIAYLIKGNQINDISRLLKENILCPNHRDDDGLTSSWTPLYWAVKLNKLECVKLFLANGADINLVINDPTECYGTALDLATLLGHEDIEDVLRQYMNDENDGKSAYKAVRSKLRSANAQAFNFKSPKRQEADMVELHNKQKLLAA